MYMSSIYSVLVLRTMVLYETLPMVVKVCYDVPLIGDQITAAYHDVYMSVSVYSAKPFLLTLML